MSAVTPDPLPQAGFVREWILTLGAAGGVMVTLRLNPQGKVIALDYQNPTHLDVLVSVTLPEGESYSWRPESEPPPFSSFPPGLAPDDCGVSLGTG